jgi:SPP1 family predicted phage head-tail adaptor
MAQIGKLNRRIVIQSFTDAQDDYGQPIRTWATLATLWASIYFKSGNEQFEADQKTALNEVIFTIRYRSDITEVMRVSYDSAFYDIRYIEEVNLKRYLMLRCLKKD